MAGAPGSLESPRGRSVVPTGDWRMVEVDRQFPGKDMRERRRPRAVQRTGKRSSRGNHWGAAL
jgi:hypothetical protein